MHLPLRQTQRKANAERIVAVSVLKRIQHTCPGSRQLNSSGCASRTGSIHRHVGHRVAGAANVVEWLSESLTARGCSVGTASEHCLHKP